MNEERKSKEQLVQCPTSQCAVDLKTAVLLADFIEARCGQQSHTTHASPLSGVCNQLSLISLCSAMLSNRHSTRFFTEENEQSVQLIALAQLVQLKQAVQWECQLGVHAPSKRCTVMAR